MEYNRPQDIAGPLRRLLERAGQDTGGGRRAAQFLLSLWNGQRYRADLQELLSVDGDAFADMLFVLQALHLSNDQLDTYLSEEIKPVLELWGTTFDVLEA